MKTSLQFTARRPMPVFSVRNQLMSADAHSQLLRSLLFPVVGKFPLRGRDLSYVLPLTGKPDASDTKTQISRE